MGPASSPPAAFTWLATALGIGLMGTALRRAITTSDADASYRSAVGLIRRLEALSGKLSGGLDAVGIAEQVMDEADERGPDPQRRCLRPLRQRLDGPPALLRRDPARRDVLGRARSRRSAGSTKR